MPPERQTYASHRRFYWPYHFVAVPILVLNLIVRVVYAVRHAGAKLNWWEIVFAIGLISLVLAARTMVLRVQDRLISLEETLRLQRSLPADLIARLGELSPGQLIALRFCADDELPDLTRSILSEPIHAREAIKQRIRNWRPDVKPRA
jgi:hypothetical protein